MKPIKSEDFSAWIDHLRTWMLTTDQVPQAELFRLTGLYQPTLSRYRKEYRETGRVFDCRLPMLKSIAQAYDTVQHRQALADLKARPRTKAPEPPKEISPDGQEPRKRRRRRRSRAARNPAS